ncbi:MAG: adenylate/guanylate cyclase domain-containing protein [Gallionellaceae bacterium]|nr:adenylate/guanylate cyclase domain-containing protein [Gallionellaceae bacterium]
MTQTKKLAILFADVSGSTALYENLGDKRALHLVARCLAILSDSMTTYHGTLIKTLGDEIMCTFPSAETAFRASIKMQLALQADNKNSEHPLYIRIGFHYGDVICDDNDIYGDTVNIAARVASMTRASQIMATRAAVDMLPPVLHDKVRQIVRAELIAKQDQLDIFQVTWAQDDMQSTRIGIPAYRKPHANNAQMTLSYRDQSCVLNEHNASLFMGRGENCELTIISNFASRQHARMEFRNGNFILTDNSTNGTYIRFENNQSVHINHAEAMLSGVGTISLGQPYAEHPTELIDFTISSSSDTP